jgi:hypothetical protein
MATKSDEEEEEEIITSLQHSSRVFPAPPLINPTRCIFATHPCFFEYMEER